MIPEEKKREERVSQMHDVVGAFQTSGRTLSPEVIEQCLEAIQNAPSVWTNYRFALFATYINDAHDRARANDLTKQERSLIKEKFIENEDEPMLYRAIASQLMVFCGMSLRSDKTVSEYYIRKAFEFINRSPAEDSGRVVLYYGHPDEQTVQDVLSQLKPAIEFNLKNMDGVPKAKSKQIEEVMKQEGMVCHTFPLKHFRGDETFKKRAKGAGRCCDYCKKSSAVEGDINADFLQTCSRCKMVFYCSEKCQKKSWKDGHKQACRKKGEILVGDDMLLVDLVSRLDLNDSFVKVVGPVEGRESRWLVKLPDRENPISIAGKNLARIRPEHCVV